MSVLTFAPPKIEEWLRQQAQKGFRLVSYKRGRFAFVEAKPNERDYFVYVSPAGMKNDAFLGEFYYMKRLYGDRKWKLHSPSCYITELRTDRMDDNFICVRFSRNTHYQKHYTRMLIAFLGATLLSVLLTQLSSILWLFAPVFLLPTLFSAVSLGILSRQRYILNNAKRKHCE